MEKIIIPPPASASDKIPHLSLSDHWSHHFEGRKAVLARLGLRMKDTLDGDRGHSVPEQAAWLVRRHYPVRPVIQEGGLVHTRNILIGALHDLAQQGCVAESTDAIVHKLRQKYEVFGRMADRYSLEIRKVGEEWAGQEVCGLLAYVLLCQFIRGNDYRNLNAALKISDGLDGSQPEAEAITFAVLHTELEIMEKVFGQT